MRPCGLRRSTTTTTCRRRAESNPAPPGFSKAWPGKAVVIGMEGLWTNHLVTCIGIVQGVEKIIRQLKKSLAAYQNYKIKTYISIPDLDGNLPSGWKPEDRECFLLAIEAVT
ncbi:hypothetical protein GGTG_09355 [Gaeumannomyces tritici R3-111a-1]|uniref:Uncharacterized protein n=1 Tax=Gaeumannomyces tritici (strain R3-111a-1) TaxID=644352 RepID=J3P758_GAET3|nr:hypothetical protein GGTG_09355 [Gaeumannomyces tritici R3-111a-1]EJT72489.1 hypothetical protein GGTG_09355 [Gaeumannomyces tritici R3-111a-1]